VRNDLNYRVSFDALAWDKIAEGIRQKYLVSGKKKLRLVEYSKTMEPHWCEKGHLGIVLEGEMQIEFQNCIMVFHKGDGITIPDGEEHRHRARLITNIVTAVFVEEPNE
jgi:mannose-6-phosphate isomerase-like protein (cupin superfamily)